MSVMKDADRGFLEDKTEQISATRDVNRFVLSLVPYEETTTYVKGTRHGPEAIIDASVELRDGPGSR